MAKRIRILSLGLLIISLFSLSACGQKRPLSLPEKPETNSQTSHSTTESTAEGKD